MPFIILAIVGIVSIFGGASLIKYLTSIDAVAASDAVGLKISYDQALNNNQTTNSGWQDSPIPLKILKQSYVCKNHSGVTIEIKRGDWQDGREAKVTTNPKDYVWPFASGELVLSSSPKFVPDEIAQELGTGRGYYYQTYKIDLFGTDGYVRGAVMAIFPDSKKLMITAGNSPRTDEVLVFHNCEIR